MLRGSPTPPGYRPQKSSPTVKVNSIVQTTLGQVELDSILANNILTLQTDVATKEAEIATKTTEITTLTSDLATAQSDLSTAQTNYNQLLASNTATVEQLVLAEAQVVSLQSSLATAQSDLATAQSDLATLQSQLATLQSDLATAQASLATAQSELATAQSDLSTANATIIDLQDQLANSGGGSITLEPYLTDLGDASWTFFPGQTSGASAQPEANFLEAYSYDAQTKVHSFTTKSIATASTSYAANTGAEFIGPKWYKLATYADGSPVMIGDSFSLTVRMEDVTKDINMSNIFVSLVLHEWPFKDDPLQTFYQNYQRPVGFCALLAGGSTKGFGGHIGSNTIYVSTSANAELLSGVGTVVLPGGTLNSSRPSWSVNWSGNYNVRYTTSTSVYYTPSTETGQMYLSVFLSTNGSVTTVGGTATMKISYSIGKLK